MPSWNSSAAPSWFDVAHKGSSKGRQFFQLAQDENSPKSKLQLNLTFRIKDKIDTALRATQRFAFSCSELYVLHQYFMLIY